MKRKKILYIELSSNFIRTDKGAISIFVLVGLLFMTAFLIILYGYNINKAKIVDEQFGIISEIYSQKNSDEESYTDIYTDLRNKNKRTLIATSENSEDTASLELTKTFEENLSNYRIYGDSSTSAIEKFTIYPNNNGFLPMSGVYPTTNETYPNATYQIIEIRRGQTLYFNYTGTVDEINNLRLRYISPETNEVINEVNKDNENEYHNTSIFYSSSSEGNGYITAKKDHKLGVMYITEKLNDFNLEVNGNEVLGVGDLITDTSDENYGKYKVTIKLSNDNKENKNVNIYLNAPLISTENISDYIDFKTGKLIRCVGIGQEGALYNLEEPEEESVDLPEISMFEDYTKIEVLTQIKPSKIEVEYVGYTLD